MTFSTLWTGGASDLVLQAAQEHIKSKEGKISHPEIQDVLAQAEITRAQVSAMWANDFEIGGINNIILRTRQGSLSKIEALLELQQIQWGKYDYH